MFARTSPPAQESVSNLETVQSRKMPNFELLSDRMARLSLETRRSREAERQERIFNDKVRTIGVSVGEGAKLNTKLC